MVIYAGMQLFRDVPEQFGVTHAPSSDPSPTLLSAPKPHWFTKSDLGEIVHWSFIWCSSEVSKLDHILLGDVDTMLFLTLNSTGWKEGPAVCPSSRCLPLNNPESPEQEAAKPVLVHCIWESKYQ